MRLLSGLVLILASAPLAAFAGEMDEHASHRTDMAAGTPGMPSEPSRTIEVTMKEASGQMTFTPNSVKASEGEQIRFLVKNDGELDHEFVLDTAENNQKHKAAMEGGGKMEAEANAVSVAPGKSAELVWKFDKAGEFEFACLIPGHYEAGMKGSVAVTSGR